MHDINFNKDCELSSLLSSFHLDQHSNIVPSGIAEMRRGKSSGQ